MGVRRNPRGPLRHAELIQVGVVDGVTFWDRTLPPNIDALSRDEDYVIEISDRHDLLAYRKLGSSNLSWAIMERNNDIDPEEIDMRLWPNDFLPGRKIKIPPRNSLNSRGII